MFDDSVVEINGDELDHDWLTFWSDTFRHTDLLQHQDGDVKMMFTNTDETTTFELTLALSEVPDHLRRLSRTGDRFTIAVETDHFNLHVDSARIERLDDGLVTIVARTLRRSFAHA